MITELSKIQAFDAPVNNKVSKPEAEAWFGRGIGHLPKFIADQPIGEATKITALVYEFAVPESNRHPNQKCPHIDTQQHLEKSGIWKALFH